MAKRAFQLNGICIVGIGGGDNLSVHDLCSLNIPNMTGDLARYWQQCAGRRKHIVPFQARDLDEWTNNQIYAWMLVESPQDVEVRESRSSERS